MTIKFGDCVLCRNTGVYKQYCPTLKRVDITTPQDGVFCTSVPTDFRVKETTCNCDWGKEREVWENRMSHPEYENPLAKMSDQDLLTYLKAMDRIDQEREKIIDSEFNICH